MKFYLILLTSLFFVSCATSKNYSQEEIKKENQNIEAFFQKKFEEGLEREPMSYTYLGQKKYYDQLGDFTYEYAKKGVALDKKTLAELKNFKYEALSEKNKLNYRIFKDQLEKSIESEKYFFHHYYLNQMFGMHSHLPTFMMNMHRIDNKKDAKDYISRVSKFKKAFDQVLKNMSIQADKGVSYPDFVFEKVISDSQNLLAGKPFQKDAKKDSDLLTDFKNKIAKIKLTKAEKTILIRELEIALTTSYQPAYKSVIAKLEEMKKSSKGAKGAWALPNGKSYYNHALKQITTTDFKADEIHKIGLSEVERIHKEMSAIKDQVGFKGSLQDFFEDIKNNKKFFYASTPKGKKQYLSDTNKIIDKMRTQLDKLFITKPKAELDVRAVEPFREKSAGIAFYQRPALNGTRPGIYYVNLSDMSSVAKYDMEALAYHEAIPGHHMQISINQELDEVPMFRKFSYFTAFTEGWGLYAEKIPKEIGFYKDPYSDFGRLSMELWRAARLVVDTGIHYHKWSREKSLDYLKENTPNSLDEITKGVDRYFVMPGQATAYKIGQLKILELRKKAKDKLGDKFDIKDFHEVVLGNGALPLGELENQINQYIESKI